MIGIPLQAPLGPLPEARFAHARISPRTVSRRVRVERPAGPEVSRQAGPGDSSTAHTLDGPFAVIGRDPQSDLMLPGAEVSRRHAFLQVVAGALFCIDLESRTKLRWAGEDQPMAHGWLDPGSEVRIGPHSVRWEGIGRDPQQASVLQVPLAFDRLEGTQALLLPRAGLEMPILVGKRESLLPLDSQLTLIGRSESCQVVLRDEVSRGSTPP